MRRVVIVLALVAGLGCPDRGSRRAGPDQQAPPPFARDGTFRTLSLRRHGGRGFCPRPGTALEAHIEVTGGKATISGSLAAEWRSGDICLRGARRRQRQPCIVEHRFDPRPVSAEGLARLKARLAAVPPGECRKDPRKTCDPCVVSSLSVDGRRVSSCCGNQDQAFEAALTRVIAAVDALANERGD
jgi:hypothetical protein